MLSTYNGIVNSVISLPLWHVCQLMAKYIGKMTSHDMTVKDIYGYSTKTTTLRFQFTAAIVMDAYVGI